VPREIRLCNTQLQRVSEFRLVVNEARKKFQNVPWTIEIEAHFKSSRLDNLSSVFSRISRISCGCIDSSSVLPIGRLERIVINFP